MSKKLPAADAPIQQIIDKLRTLVTDTRFAAAEGGHEYGEAQSSYGRFIAAHGRQIAAALTAAQGGAPRQQYRQATAEERAMARGFVALWDDAEVQDADDWLYVLRNRAELLASLDEDEDDCREAQDNTPSIGPFDQSPSPALTAGPQPKSVEWALDNVYMLARREINRLTNSATCDPTNPKTAERSRERWQHVLRICEEAGCQPDGLLREEAALTAGQAGETQP